MTQCLFCGRYDNWKNYVAQTISILFIAAAMFNLIPRKKLGKELIQNEKSKRKIYDYLRKPVIETSWLKGR